MRGCVDARMRGCDAGCASRIFLFYAAFGENIDMRSVGDDDGSELWYNSLKGKFIEEKRGGDMTEEKGVIDSEFGLRKELYLETLKKFRLMDDDFMAVIFDDIPCTEMLLRIILKRDDLYVKEVRPQYEIKNLGGRSVRLDIFAVDQNEHAYNIEIQRKDSGAVKKRARYNSSLLDAHMTLPGDDYETLADTYIIFITENDVLKKELPIYHIERIIKETNEDFCDGSHIVYVNSTIRDETALGRLMHDFFCTDPNEMYYQTLAERARYFKENEKGVKAMCQMMQDLRTDGYNEGWEGGWKDGWEGGLSEGEEKKAKTIAWNLKKLGMDSVTIAGAVGYDAETVEGWIKEEEHHLS